jgi:hypothetical protein
MLKNRDNFAALAATVLSRQRPERRYSQHLDDESLVYGGLPTT